MVLVYEELVLSFFTFGLNLKNAIPAKMVTLNKTMFIFMLFRINEMGYFVRS